MAGAPEGNQNPAKGKKWKAAIDRALETRSRVEGREMLDALADELINQALAGEQWAFQQLGDRLDGKAAQGVIVEGGDAPVKTEMVFRWAQSNT